MGRFKVRHMVFRKGGYYFQPTPKMREAGFLPIPLGKDSAKAAAEAERRNAAWDETRPALKRGVDPKKLLRDGPDLPGSIFAVMSAFREDPAFYLQKAPRTKADIDRAFHMLRELRHRDKPDGPPALKGFRMTALRRRHVKDLYGRFVEDHGEHVAHMVIKWLRRLCTFAIDQELIAENPAVRLGLAAPQSRSQQWTPAQIDRFVAAAMTQGVRSMALAVSVAYDTAQRPADLMRASLADFDGEGLRFQQAKVHKTGARPKIVWAALSPRSIAMIEEEIVRRRTAAVADLHLLIDEGTGRPFANAVTFGRRFREVKRAARLPAALKFGWDLKRTAMSEAANSGATDAELSGFSGNRIGSPSNRVYQIPGKAAARSALQKRLSQRERDKNEAQKVGTRRPKSWNPED